MKKYYHLLRNNGLSNTLSDGEQKKVKLLNLFCGTWLLIELIALIGEVIFIPDLKYTFFTHSVNIMGMATTLLLQRNSKYLFARTLFIVMALFSNFMYCNFISPGHNMEYAYSVIPAFVLLFTNNKYIVSSFFVISFGLFIIPKTIFDIYPNEPIEDSYVMIVLFIINLVLVKYFKDESTKNELKLNAQKDELAQLNEMQSQFFINVSHEIRTPLTLIKGQINKLKELNKLQEDDTIESAVLHLDNQSEKIKKIVNDVIDLAKMKSSNFKMNLQSINLLELVRRLHSSFEPLFLQKQVELNIKHDIQSEDLVLADVSFLERAINNIISNALKFTDKHGKVSIHLSELNDYFKLDIIDNGIGVSEKDQSKIFNRFYQVDNDINKSGGSGVGLTFSDEIIKKHMGTISLNSELGQGSIFTIKLPKVYQETNKSIDLDMDSNLEEISLHKPGFIKETKPYLLIVDDSKEIRDYLKDILTDYNCLEAEDGIEALEKVNSTKVDFIVTDYMMPKMNGLELIAQLKLNHDIPTLMLTASNDKDIKMSTFQLGVNDYISKPFDEEELKIRIKNSLYYKYNRDKFKVEENIIEAVEQTDDWILEVQKFIEANCGKTKIKQADVANEFNMSASSFYRRIKSKIGMTPNEFITEVKLQKARRLIENKEVNSLKHLTLEIGFSNSNYFSKMYLERFGRKPWSKAAENI